MWYVYVLHSQRHGKLYIGMTGDLKQRMAAHRSGSSSFTRRNGPWKLIFYEAFLSKSDALRDERFFKSGYGREVLKGKLQSTLPVPH